MTLPPNIKSHDAFKRYWPEYNSCDFCGRQTRGRVYETDPTQAVFCGSCHRTLIDGEQNEMPRVQSQD